MLILIQIGFNCFCEVNKAIKFSFNIDLNYNAAQLPGYPKSGFITPRQYVSYHYDNHGHVYKGEDDNTALSYLSEATVWAKLCDRIYDSTLPIILISPNMKGPYKIENAQWIPWKVSYSLRQATRSDRTSRPNTIIAVIQPDSKRSYGNYYTNS